ncbi:zinc finger Y-chromosomal protein 2-like [Haematobia irritans]|uniref:zinc finger Y-chromosomal protein 2-like n=1 Tax=Haematobia irritans TaxID=7368 RepID=UPI003F50BB2D
MREKQFCRLCINLCSEYKEMCNEKGQETYIYEMALKYFDPQLLKAVDDQESQVVCLECWETIDHFHTFQINILKAHEELEKSLQEIAHIAMNEEEINLGMDIGAENTFEMRCGGENERIDIEETKRKKNTLMSRKSSCAKKSISSTRRVPLIRSKKQLCDDNTENSNVDIDAIIAQWKPELECAFCTATATTFNLLRLHYRNEHPNEKCYATCCGRKFAKRCGIYEHIQVHLDPNTFRCNVCGKCSTSSRNLSKHIRELHTDEGKKRPFQCQVCQKHFQNKTNLRTHMETHLEVKEEHMCRDCGKGFSTEQRRKVHERTVHNVDRVCEECGKIVHGIYALKRHLQEHAGLVKQKWPCDLCETELHSHSGLKRHKLLRHNDGSTAYVCSDCGKISPSRTALYSHKRLVHMMERKYKCEICGKSFKFSHNLKEHLAWHTNTDLYQCPHCPKTFKMKANMQRHRKRDHQKEWSESGDKKHIRNRLNLNIVKNEIIL